MSKTDSATPYINFIYLVAFFDIYISLSIQYIILIIIYNRDKIKRDFDAFVILRRKKSPTDFPSGIFYEA